MLYNFDKFYDFICPDFNKFKEFSDIKNQYKRLKDNESHEDKNIINKIL